MSGTSFIDGRVVCDGFPRCAVCRAPVDRVIRLRDAEGRFRGFVAECHGESERVNLSETESSGLLAVTFETAFMARPG